MNDVINRLLIYSGATIEWCDWLAVDISEKEEELESTRARLNRQLADTEFARSTLERQKVSLESELSATQQEVAGLKSTVAQMSASQAGIEAELSATKVIIDVLVLSHWAHFTVHRFICVRFLLYCICVILL